MIAVRVLLYIVVFFVSVIYFLPKNDIVDFAVKNYAVQQGADIKIELNNKLFNYVAKDGKVFYKDAQILNIKDLKIDPFILFNGIKGENITLEGMAAGFFPKNIKQFNANYSVLDLKKVNFNANGDFGSLTGSFEFETLKVSVQMNPSALMKKRYSFVLKNMKKTAKNYTYEYKL